MEIAKLKFGFVKGGEIMLGSLINLDQPSKISLERRQELNQLAVRAAKSNGDLSGSSQLETLRGECYKMDEIYQEITGVGDTHDRFFYDIDYAFKTLIPSNPDALGTYMTLSRLLRVLATHNDLIYRKMSEVNKIVDDIDIIEKENWERGKHE